MKSKSTVYLSLGSNLHDRFQHLKNAQIELKKDAGEITAISEIYENPPSGFEADLDFLNICIELITDHSPQELLKIIKGIEQRLGRSTSQKEGYSSRCIDIDIILFQRTIINSEKLTIPHLHFRKRMFVLKPLNDIASNEIDPETMLTVRQLFNNCSDTSNLEIYNG